MTGSLAVVYYLSSAKMQVQFSQRIKISRKKLLSHYQYAGSLGDVVILIGPSITHDILYFTKTVLENTADISSDVMIMN